MTAQEAYTRLLDAIDRNTPACHGDDRFIADKLTPDEKEQLEAICWSCPVRGACAAYASEAKPKAGYYPTTTKKGRPELAWFLFRPVFLSAGR